MKTYVLKAARQGETKREDLGEFKTVREAYKKAFSLMRSKIYNSIMIWDDEEVTAVIILRWSRGFRNSLTMRPMHTNQTRLFIKY